ncbi:GSCOCG00000914001-RA-CDS [Cotesia congregata]|uniref:Uncharacterized protein n=1 Tax=Cotesia congregata TaxID=51543 RepID=A0A8J2HFW9_COTCN|nr:GSCOCG00000914001-RA-CDS [Cotesia congregata]CAG5095762.1 Protein of unknown function [Cotesia congregata]
MRVIAFLIGIGIFSCVQTQENAQRKLSSGLLECYNSSFVVLKDNHLPYTMDTFIAILRKIEDSPSFNMDLRQFTVSLLNRFRQDGIIENTESKPALGVIPYAPNSFQFYKNAAILKLIQGNGLHFPNSSISLLERCALHFILSSTIDFKERGDEPTTCQTQNSPYRWKRNIDKGTGDVETLSPEELEIIKNKNNESKEGDFDPNSFYPVLPPNHPENAQYKQPVTSKCPLESGVIHTKWGTVAGGPLLAGIAAALQPEKIKISDLVFRNWRLNENLSDVRLDNKWLATLAGDLAEVVISQGPFKNLDERFQIGIEGHWNSTVSQKYYFLNEDENVEFTAAEVRGDLDGLILANTVMTWYQSIPSLKLSQIFDMYYSDRGLFNVSTRACDRRALLTSVAPNDTTSAQVYTASLALEKDISTASMSPELINSLSVKATNELFNFIPSSLNNDLGCDANLRSFNRLAVDLTIFIDTNWKFPAIQPILTLLLENCDINKYASNFTLINAFDGNVLINSSNNILDFYSFNETQYSSLTMFKNGFDLPKSLEVLKIREEQKLNREWESKIGGQRSEIVLILPSATASISDSDKTFCLDRLKTLKETVPDATLLFLTPGSKDKWAEMTVDSINDIVSFSNGNTKENSAQIINLVNRMKQVPRRLINTQCGASYTSSGNSESYTNYLEPSGITFYRLHPNYFYKIEEENLPTIKIQSYSGTRLTICTSRDPININVTSSNCVTTDTHSETIYCPDPTYIHECKPFYLSIAANDHSYSPCNAEPERCRYPDMTKYTISYENLVCVSSASSAIISPIVYFITIMYIYTRH